MKLVVPRAVATCAGQLSPVWNTAPLDRPWVSESPTVTKWFVGFAGMDWAPTGGAPNGTPSVGSVMRGGATSVTSTSAGVWESSISGGRSLTGSSSGRSRRQPVATPVAQPSAGER